MVKFVVFFVDGHIEEYERPFPQGVLYGAERSREVLALQNAYYIDGYFIYDDKDFAIVERGIFFLNVPIDKGGFISLTAG
jgi:hypothetical protein